MTGVSSIKLLSGRKSSTTRRDWSPPPLHISTRKVLYGWGEGGGLLPHQNPGFLRRPRLYCYGAWNFWAIGTKGNSEIVRSTHLSPSLNFAYVSFEPHISLSALLSLLNITAELGGGMISAALTGRLKPTQSGTFNELDSETIVTTAVWTL